VKVSWVKEKEASLHVHDVLELQEKMRESELG